MNVIQRMGSYVPRKRSLDEAIADKMKVLREFYVVNETNADNIEATLRLAVNDHPDVDYERVIDVAARPLIEKRLNS